MTRAVLACVTSGTASPKARPDGPIYLTRCPSLTLIRATGKELRMAIPPSVGVVNGH